MIPLDYLAAFAADRPSLKTKPIYKTVAPHSFAGSTEAFLRLETPDDLRDAAFLIASGCNVAFEPVRGSLTGFFRPVKLTIIRRVSDAVTRAPKVNRRRWSFKLADDPTSIATAVHTLLVTKDEFHELIIDMSEIPAGDRSKLLADAFEGMVRLINYRAGGRQFYKTDIIDLMEWIGMLGTGRLRAQIGYSDREWPFAVRRERFDKFGGWHVPESRRIGVTLVATVKPDRADLEEAVRAMPSLGLVNAVNASSKAAYFTGSSTNHDMLLGNHCVATWTTGDAPGEVLTTAGYLTSLADLDPLLQPAWTHQRTALRLFGTPACGDRELIAGMHTADALKTARPLVVGRIGEPEPVTIADALSRWDTTFIAADLRP